LSWFIEKKKFWFAKNGSECGQQLLLSNRKFAASPLVGSSEPHSFNLRPCLLNDSRAPGVDSVIII
jgi:hypothetical protein